ncbi:hypothetical protein DCS_01562 [Drechmeria coniospora]|uniref:Uncharacterized protein n=1 Tax=Drechmeria coniospora TaxID=98403 RepID=A0A151GTJ1_DRECN|nr:hypothetical protein DCS_01562 [Drechmeria coniospora]KYK60425.1 hypothetical protein DCS_01562 [Drechmeria coniospora]
MVMVALRCAADRAGKSGTDDPGPHAHLTPSLLWHPFRRPPPSRAPLRSSPLLILGSSVVAGELVARRARTQLPTALLRPRHATCPNPPWLVCGSQSRGLPPGATDPDPLAAHSPHPDPLPAKTQASQFFPPPTSQRPPKRQPTDIRVPGTYQLPAAKAYEHTNTLRTEVCRRRRPREAGANKQKSLDAETTAPLLSVAAAGLSFRSALGTRKRHLLSLGADLVALI